MNKRLKELRKVLGLTQWAFSKRLGVTFSAISQIERGERNLTEQMLISICRAYNVNETWLRTGEGEMFTGASGLNETIKQLARLHCLNEKEARLLEGAINTFLRLPENGRKAVSDAVDAFIANYYAEKGEQKPALTYEEAEAAYVEQAAKEARERFRRERAQAKPAEPTLDEQADAFAALAREQFLREKKQESSTSFASESGAG